MGVLSDAMQRLVDDINSSTESRKVRISEINSDAHNLLGKFHLERRDIAIALKETAEALKEKLNLDEKARSDATQQFIKDTRSELDDMSDTLRKKLSSDKKALSKTTQLFIKDVRSELDEIADAVKEAASLLNEKLSSDSEVRREAAQQFINALRSELQEMADTLRGKLSSDEEVRSKATQSFTAELASDRREAGEIWSRDSGKQGGQVRETEPSYENQILQIAAKNPDGVKLVDIGNELGVDWRSLIGVIKSLMDEGKIDKIDSLYYLRK